MAYAYLSVPVSLGPSAPYLIKVAGFVPFAAFTYAAHATTYAGGST